MIRATCRLRSVTSLFAAIFAVAAFVPTRAWATGPSTLPAVASGAGISGKSSDDDADEASRLMVMTDFNRDGIADIAEAVANPEDPSGPNVLTVMLGQADGTLKPVASHPTLGHDPKSIVAGDFNRDGIPDLIAGDDDGKLTLFVGDGAGNLSSVGDIIRLESVVSIAVADFNHDGVPDIVVSDWRSGSVTVLQGVGDGSFQRGWSFPLRMPGTTPHLVTADFNGDGIPDMAVVYDDDEGATYEVMLGNGNGTFTAAPDRSFVKDPNSHCAT